MNVEMIDYSSFEEIPPIGELVCFSKELRYGVYIIFKIINSPLSRKCHLISLEDGRIIENCSPSYKVIL